MEKQYSVRFFNSFLANIHKSCQSFVSYGQTVEVSGYLSLEIDNVKKERYVLCELIQSSGNVISESYCTKVSRTCPVPKILGKEPFYKPAPQSRGTESGQRPWTPQGQSKSMGQGPQMNNGMRGQRSQVYRAPQCEKPIVYRDSNQGPQMNRTQIQGQKVMQNQHLGRMDQRPPANKVPVDRQMHPGSRIKETAKMTQNTLVRFETVECDFNSGGQNLQNKPAHARGENMLMRKHSTDPQFTAPRLSSQVPPPPLPPPPPHHIHQGDRGVDKNLDKTLSEVVNKNCPRQTLDQESIVIEDDLQFPDSKAHHAIASKNNNVKTADYFPAAEYRKTAQDWNASVDGKQYSGTGKIQDAFPHGPEQSFVSQENGRILETKVSKPSVVVKPSLSRSRSETSLRRSVLELSGEKKIQDHETSCGKIKCTSPENLIKPLSIPLTKIPETVCSPADGKSFVKLKPKGFADYPMQDSSKSVFGASDLSGMASKDLNISKKDFTLLPGMRRQTVDSKIQSLGQEMSVQQMSFDDLQKGHWKEKNTSDIMTISSAPVIIENSDIGSVRSHQGQINQHQAGSEFERDRSVSMLKPVNLEFLPETSNTSVSTEFDCNTQKCAKNENESSNGVNRKRRYSQITAKVVPTVKFEDIAQEHQITQAHIEPIVHVIHPQQGKKETFKRPRRMKTAAETVTVVKHLMNNTNTAVPSKDSSKVKKTSRPIQRSHLKANKPGMIDECVSTSASDTQGKPDNQKMPNNKPVRARSKLECLKKQTKRKRCTKSTKTQKSSENTDSFHETPNNRLYQQNPQNTSLERSVVGDYSMSGNSPNTKAASENNSLLDDKNIQENQENPIELEHFSNDCPDSSGLPGDLPALVNVNTNFEATFMTPQECMFDSQCHESSASGLGLDLHRTLRLPEPDWTKDQMTQLQSLSSNNSGVASVKEWRETAHQQVLDGQELEPQQSSSSSKDFLTMDDTAQSSSSSKAKDAKKQTRKGKHKTIKPKKVDETDVSSDEDSLSGPLMPADRTLRSCGKMSRRHYSEAEGISDSSLEDLAIKFSLKKKLKSLRSELEQTDEVC